MNSEKSVHENNILGTVQTYQKSIGSIMLASGYSREEIASFYKKIDEGYFGCPVCELEKQKEINVIIKK